MDRSASADLTTFNSCKFGTFDDDISEEEYEYLYIECNQLENLGPTVELIAQVTLKSSLILGAQRDLRENYVSCSASARANVTDIIFLLLKNANFLKVFIILFLALRNNFDIA